MKIRDRFMTRVWYAAQRHNLTIPFPIRTLYHFDGPTSKVDGTSKKFAESLESIPAFVSLAKEQEGLSSLSQGVVLQHFGVDEKVIQQGHPMIERQPIAREIGRIIEARRKAIRVVSKQRLSLGNRLRSIEILQSKDWEFLIVSQTAIQFVEQATQHDKLELGFFSQGTGQNARLLNNWHWKLGWK